MPIFHMDLIDVESTIDDNYFRESRRTYRVFSPTSMDENQVRSGLGFAIYDLHPSDRRQILRRISIRLDAKNAGVYANPTTPGDPNNGQACFIWLATLEYGPWNPLEHTATGAPQDQPVRLEFEGVVYQEIADYDKDGNPVVNTAYDFFDPPVMRDRTRPDILIIRNELTFSDSTILAYADKVNSDTFYNYKPRTLKISAPKAVQKYSQFSDVNYFEVTYRLEFNPNTWVAQPQNRGFRELKTISGKVAQAQIFDGQGQPIQDAYFLDQNGKALPPPVNAKNIWQPLFYIYDELDFTSTFGLAPGLLN